MRIGLALVLFAACIQPAPDPGPDPGPGPEPGGWGTGPGGTGGDSSYGCHADTDCGGGGFVCARDGECLGSAEVRTIHVTWTVNGAAADTTSCANEPDLDITFRDANQEQFGFSPVPCVEGKFTIDKLPNRFETVELAKTGDDSNFASGVFGSDGTVALDLSY